MRQSSHLDLRLPAATLVAALVLWPHAAFGQQSYRVLRTENFRREPDPSAPRLATVNAGVELTADSSHGQWVRVALEGWIWARSLEATDRDGFDQEVRARGENLRDDPNGRILARLDAGALVDELERRPGWVRVRRVGWMYRPSLDAAGGVPTPPTDSERSAGVPDSAALLDRAVTSAAATLHRVAGESPTGRLEPETPVRIQARSGEWVRVQLDGWVRESDLKPSSPGVLVGVSGAEVRAQPAEFENRVVQWVVQLIAIQSADELRREIPVGQRYLLTRGPLPESGFVYVIPTPEQLAQIERLPPLAELTIVGRVRSGRSQYLGNPVLTLLEFAARRE
jgi:SH3-like domain-containing protein